MNTMTILTYIVGIAGCVLAVIGVRMPVAMGHKDLTARKAVLLVIGLLMMAMSMYGMVWSTLRVM